MPAKPLSDETLHLIDSVREALAEHGAEVQEKRMFGCHVFMVDGKMCLGVEHDELLVRLPPSSHAEVAETAGVRPLSSRGLMDGYFLIGPAAYATRAQWQHWIDAALAFNPLAKATPKKKAKPQATDADSDAVSPKAAPKRSAKKSSPGAAVAPQSPQTLKDTRSAKAVAAPTPPVPTPRKHSVFDDDDDL